MRPPRLLLLIALAYGAAGCVRAGFSVGGDGGTGDAGDAVTETADGGADRQPEGPLVPGSHLWAQRLGRAGAVAHIVVAAAADGDALLAGSFRGIVDLGGGELTSAGDADVFVARFDGGGAHRWSTSFGGGGTVEPLDIAVDASDHVFVAGRFSGAIAAGSAQLTSAGGADVFVVSLDASGGHRWAKRFGGPGEQRPSRLAVDASGGVALTGRFAESVDFGGGTLTSAGNSDVFVASLDAAGAHRWSLAAGGSSADQGHALAVDANGNVAVTGVFHETIDLGGGLLTSSGSTEIFLASFAAGGTHRWSKRFGDAGVDAGKGVGVDAGGNVTVTGFFQGSVDFGGGALTTLGPTDAFVASFTASGAHRWSTSFGSTDSAGGTDIAVTPAGDITVAGSGAAGIDFGGGALTSAGGVDVFLASFTSAGAHRWSASFGGATDDECRRVAVDPSGNALVAGAFKSAIDLGGGALSCRGFTDLFAARFDAAGQHRWSRGFAGSGAEDGRGVGVDLAGNVTVSGRLWGAAAVGGDELRSAGQFDIMLATFDQHGAHRWSARYGGPLSDNATSHTVGPDGTSVVVGIFSSSTFEIGGVELSSAGGQDLFAASLAEGGALGWARSFGGGGTDSAQSVAVDGAGNVVVVGSFTETIDLGGAPLTSAGAADVFVASFTATGAHRWSRRFGDAEAETAQAVAVDPSGNIAVTGIFGGAIDLGGGPLTGGGAPDIFVVSLAPDGSHRWSAAFGDAEADVAEGIACDAAGNVTITGSFQQSVDLGGGALQSAGSTDVLVASFSADGTHRWSRSFGGASIDGGKAIAATASGEIYVTGSFFDSIDIGGAPLASVASSDIFLASFDADGAHRWSRAFGGGGADTGTGVAVTSRLLVLTGSFAERVDFGGGPLHSAGAGFVAAFVP